MSFSVGLIGARGYVGGELIRLIARHPRLELGFVSSREWAGQPLSAQLPAHVGGQRFVSLSADAAARSGVDVLVLAMPNGAAAPFVDALDQLAPGTLVVDLSADYRFRDDWYYGLPELTRSAYRGQRRISNPGCYATAMQIAVAPMLAHLAGPVQCFGVSGYSGAGTSPSDKNDPDKLRDNLMAYSLTGHLHEKEVSRQLAHPIEFMPHVAAYFRGLSITANLHLTEPLTREQVLAIYRHRYRGEPLVAVEDEAPWVSRAAQRMGVQVGGFTLSADARRLALVCTLDNLLKGAASQAVQNINLALGLDELSGVEA